jgi:hypothetical protein
MKTVKTIVYLTAAAEDRYRREIIRADIVGIVYGDHGAATRIRDRAIKRLEPYRTVWWKQAVKQEEPQ